MISISFTFFYFPLYSHEICPVDEKSEIKSHFVNATFSISLVFFRNGIFYYIYSTRIQKNIEIDQCFTVYAR